LSSKDDVLYPRLFLYAHAIELAFKAFIFEKEGKIKNTHNLLQLQKKAEDLGMSFSDTFKSILKTFSRLNEDDYRMRYFKSGATAFPNNEILSVETKYFIKQVALFIPDGMKMISMKGGVYFE